MGMPPDCYKCESTLLVFISFLLNEMQLKLCNLSCSYLHDVIYITAFVQIASIISGKFWWTYLVVSKSCFTCLLVLNNNQLFCSLII